MCAFPAMPQAGPDSMNLLPDSHKPKVSLHRVKPLMDGRTSSPPGGANQSITLNSQPELDEFLNYLRVEKGLAANSLLSYRRDLSAFCLFMRRQGRSIREATREDIRKFLAGLFRRNLAARTVARHRVSLRNLFRFLLQEKQIRADPAVDVDAPRIGQSLPKYLKVEEVETLLAAGPGSGIGGPHRTVRLIRCSAFWR